MTPARSIRPRRDGRPLRRSLLRDLPGLGEDAVVIRLRLLLRALPGPADDTAAVDDENGALGHPRVTLHVVAAHAERGHELALEVADQLERQPAQLCRERLVREDGVDADAIDADAGGFSLWIPGPKLGQLCPSTTGEIEHIEKEDESLVLLERLGQRQLVVARRGQLEIGRLVPDLQHPKSLATFE